MPTYPWQRVLWRRRRSPRLRAIRQSPVLPGREAALVREVPGQRARRSRGARARQCLQAATSIANDPWPRSCSGARDARTEKLRVARQNLSTGICAARRQHGAWDARSQCVAVGFIGALAPAQQDGTRRRPGKLRQYLPQGNAHDLPDDDPSDGDLCATIAIRPLSRPEVGTSMNSSMSSSYPISRIMEPSSSGGYES